MASMASLGRSPLKPTVATKSRWDSGVDPFVQLLKDLLGPGAALGGLGGMFIYFRKSEKELRDELRIDNDRLRTQVGDLRNELARVEADNDALRHRLRGERE